jgi:UDP-N-acetylmuramoyl-tripeptide--D-alanyl-D-alanine ligase
MMSALLLSDIAKATGGQLFGEASFSNVCTDTRDVKSGDLFVALVGDHYDGNQFVLDAGSAGAVAAVVSDNVTADIPYVKVDDTRFALGQIAKLNRRKFSGPLVALTGSAGKTTTKEMVASILSEKGAVLATEANFNNEIGVPLTLLAIDKSHQFAVVEMGASGLGDIAYLTQFAEPTIAVLTNAMAVHIEGFGSIGGVAKTKGEIFENLPQDGVAIINQDEPFFQQWKQQAGNASVTTFSKSDTSANFYASDIRVQKDGSTAFELHALGQTIAIKLGLLGEHNVLNAVAAAAAAVTAGATVAEVKKGLERVKPVDGRLKVCAYSGCTVIDDSYNASPSSVKAAIDVLSGFPGRRCLILGTMGELGDLAESGHRDVAEYARAKGIEQLLVVGEFAPLVAEVFGAGCLPFDELQQLLDDLDKSLSSTVVLVKGSRSAHMERVVEALKNNNKRDK